VLERGLNAPVTTSAGRLFDAAAALLHLRSRASFEGQAAMDVEFAADTMRETVAPWPMPIIDGRGKAPFQLDWEPLLAGLLATDHTNVNDRATAAARFHATLATAISAVAQRIGIRSVVLTGGCFQNARLLAAATAALQAGGFTVLQHRALPANDGALAAGQALGAAWGITEVRSGGSSRD
jgi:hydrogenase maturation protein HypF